MNRELAYNADVCCPYKSNQYKYLFVLHAIVMFYKNLRVDIKTAQRLLIPAERQETLSKSKRICSIYSYLYLALLFHFIVTCGIQTLLLFLYKH